MKKSMILSLFLFFSLLLTAEKTPLFPYDRYPLHKSETRIPSHTANAFYLRNFEKMPWWNQDWHYRVPLVIYETTGKVLHFAVIDFERKLPRNVDLSSLRIVTAGGNLVPMQYKLLDERQKMVRITFMKKLPGYSSTCLFLYYDDKPKSKVEYDTFLSLKEEKLCFSLRNSKIVAKLFKNNPDVAELYPAGSDFGNQMNNDLGLSSLGAGLIVRSRNKLIASKGRIVENGPVRIIIDYPDKSMLYRYIFNADARTLFYQYELLGNQMSSITVRNRWNIGAGSDRRLPDKFYYVAPDGVKARKLDMNNSCMDVNVYMGKLKNYADGNWYAIENAFTGQTMGEFFDGRRLENIRPWQAGGNWGYVIDKGAILRPNSCCLKGGIVSLPNHHNWKYVLREYEFFINPPELMLGNEQKKSAVPAPKVPVFGKDIILSYHMSPKNNRSLYLFIFRNNPVDIVPYWMRSFRDKGANFISIWPQRHFYLEAEDKQLAKNHEFFKELFVQARKNGYGIWVNTPARGDNVKLKSDDIHKPTIAALKKYGRGVESRTAALSKLSEVVAGFHPDIYLLSDEWTYHIVKEEVSDIKTFKNRYNMNPVFEVNPEKLKEPEQHLTALYNINALLTILKKMAETVKSVDKNIIIGNQVNIRSMIDISKGGPQDWEKMADFLDVICMDLYGHPGKLFKYFLKYMMSMFNNDRPFLNYTGCETKAWNLYSNIMFPLMWGSGGIALFPSRDGYLNKYFYSEAERTYKYLNYTGLGDMFARSRPVKRTAILRDRTAMIDDIKNGRWQRYGSHHSLLLKTLCYLNSFQVNFVMSKYFNMETMKDYSSLIIVSNPILSDQHAETIAKFAESGGFVFIEGEAAKNVNIQKLCGIKYDGKISEQDINAVGKYPFKYKGKACEIRNDGAEVIGKNQNNQPVVLMKKAGKGTVIYTPVFISLCILTDKGQVDFLRRVIDDYAGRQLVEINREALDCIDSNLQTDGKNYLLTVHSDYYQCRKLKILDKSKKFKIIWNGEKMPEIVASYSTGAIFKFPEKRELSLTLKPGEYKNFYLGSKEDFIIPKFDKYPVSKMMTFCPEAKVMKKSSSGLKPAMTGSLLDEQDRKKAEKTVDSEEAIDSLLDD